jgi:lipopolysaccharide/colanic/teichoic acid biosynthesis glycosyltransferase
MDLVMKRIADVLLSLLLLCVLSIPMILIALIVKLTSKGPALY